MPGAGIVCWEYDETFYGRKRDIWEAGAYENGEVVKDIAGGICRYHLRYTML